jgi:hypothetical protein
MSTAMSELSLEASSVMKAEAVLVRTGVQINSVNSGHSHSGGEYMWWSPISKLHEESV